MSDTTHKIVQDSHIIGERGVIKFHEYCNKHQPYICFREISRNDFGIDGEVELIEIREDGKKYMTGQLVKVQLKSSFGEGGYINKRQDGSFAFYPKQADINYWSNYSLDVVLVIYDDSDESLYAKKIEKMEFDISKNALKKKKGKTYSIDFNENFKLKIGENGFFENFKQHFSSRVHNNVSEKLFSNIVEVKLLSKKMFFYQSKFSSKKSLYEHFKNDNDAPYFILYGSEIITLHRIEQKFDSFANHVLQNKTPTKEILFSEILKNDIYRRYFTELLKEILRRYFHTKGILYNKDYNRFYFSKPREGENRTIETFSRKTLTKGKKSVVSFHEYGKDSFYKHFAFEIEFIFNQSDILLAISPKYLFTSDGRTVIPPKKVTKYTNFLTAREWNDQVLNQLNSIINFLKNIENGVSILNTEDINLSLSFFIPQIVDFGIPNDSYTVVEKKEKNEKKQTDLFI